MRRRLISSCGVPQELGIRPDGILCVEAVLRMHCICCKPQRTVLNITGSVHTLVLLLSASGMRLACSPSEYVGYKYTSCTLLACKG